MPACFTRPSRPDLSPGLLLGRLLAQVGDLRGAPALLELLGPDRTLSLGSLATLKLGTFDTDEAVMDGIVEFIGELIPEDDPELYCEACLALAEIGDGANRRAALRYLQRTRESIDEDTQRTGALALGRTASSVWDLVKRTLDSGRRELQLVQSQDEIASPRMQFDVTRVR